MTTFEVFLDNQLVYKIEADYYKEHWFNRDLLFYQRMAGKFNRDLKVGHFEHKSRQHIAVRRVTN